MNTSPTGPNQPFKNLGSSAALFAAAAIAFGAWSMLGSTASAEQALLLPAPVFESAPTAQGPQTVVFAGGCFWGVQAVFQHTRGVLNAVSGYAGGGKDTANYNAIGSGRTGHAESVQVTYDPTQVSYGKLLQIYFGVAHDPTQLDRQGPDTGTQYRSAVFYKDDSQKQVTERYMAQLEASKIFKDKIVTQLVPLSGAIMFYQAEGYHQDYATLHPNQPYIAQFDLPKLASLKRVMPNVWRETPVLVAAKP